MTVLSEQVTEHGVHLMFLLLFLQSKIQVLNNLNSMFTMIQQRA